MKQLTYDIKDLWAYIEELTDLSVLVFVSPNIQQIKNLSNFF